MKFVVTAVFLMIGLSPTALPQGKPRVAVFPLEFGTVKSEAAAIFGTNSDAGKGIADLIVAGLTKQGNFLVFERTQLDKILTEQDASKTFRFDGSTAAAMGKVIGVQAVIMGSITRLGKEDRNLMGYKTTKAIVSLTVRAVDTSTSQVLLSASGDGEATRKGISLSNPQGQQVAFGSSFKESVIGEAAGKAVDQVVASLNSQAQRFPAAPPSVSEVRPSPVPVADPPVTTEVATPQKAPVAPLTMDLLLEMLKSGVPDDQVAEIVQSHENFAISPTDPNWAISVARQKISLQVQNAVRQKAGLPPIAAPPAGAKTPGTAKPAPAKQPPAAPVKKSSVTMPGRGRTIYSHTSLG